MADMSRKRPSGYQFKFWSLSLIILVKPICIKKLYGANMFRIARSNKKTVRLISVGVIPRKDDF